METFLSSRIEGIDEIKWNSNQIDFKKFTKWNNLRNRMKNLQKCRKNLQKCKVKIYEIIVVFSVSPDQTQRQINLNRR